MIARGTATKIGIKDIADGEFVRSTERWEPNYLVTSFNPKVSRVRVLATVVSTFVSEDKNFSTITLDDGSDTITVRGFEEDREILDGVNLGDIVDVVGKVKEYQEERYITPESIWKIDDPNWELVRRLELLSKTKGQSSIQEVETTPEEKVKFEDESKLEETSSNIPQAGEIEVVEEVIGVEPVKEPPKEGTQDKPETPSEGKDTDKKSSILKLIRNMDEGDGVKYVTLLRESKLDEDALESVLNDLMADGDVYEPKIGRFKGI